MNNQTIKAVQDFLESYGLSTTLAIVLGLHIVIGAWKPENLKVIYGGLLYFLSIPIKFLRKQTIRFKIEGPCTKALKKISKEIPEIDVPDIKVSWVNEDNLKSKLESGKAIVNLKFDKDNTKNIIKAANIYVRDAFLPHTKNYLNIDFRKAIDLAVTKKILYNISKKENNRHIVTQFIDENSEHEPEVFEKSEKIEEIDDNGLFTRILLRELDSFGHDLFGRTQKPDYSKEADDFLTFVHEISTRDHDDFTPLTFPKNVIKVGVVLIAKAETYYQYGVEPYLRRIKLGMNKGIENFYLLARSDKIDILENVVTDLLHSGNFLQINNAKEYKDVKNRKVRCFCLQVNEDSILANSLKEIGDSIKSENTIDGIITKVRQDKLQLDFNGIEGFISKNNLSVLEIEDARLYFTENSSIEAKPIEVKNDGIVEFTLKNTNSDPNHLLTTKFTLNSIIEATVIYIDDSFIKLDVGHDKVEGIAFRNDLTHSRFIFLHEKFQEGQDLQVKIKGYNYEKANIIVELPENEDPWPPKNLKELSQTKVKICKKTNRSLVGEIYEGIEGVIPYWELSYFENQIEKEKNKIKLNDDIDCLVTKIDFDEKIVFLSYRNLFPNPYNDFFNENQNEIFQFRIKDVNPYGISGVIWNTDKPYDIYIPKYETSWKGEILNYKIGTKKKVSIKDLDKKGDRLIGSFKPLLTHPLTDFKKEFSEGQILKNLKLSKEFEFGLIYSINLKKNNYEGVLFKGEISNLCFIKDCTGLSNLTDISLQIKRIDLDKNRIVLSLKDLTKLNRDRINKLDYYSELDSIIIDKHNNLFVVLIYEFYVEGYLETKYFYNIGQKTKVRPSLIDEDKLIVTDE